MKYGTKHKDRRKDNRRKGPWFDPYYDMEYKRRRQTGNRRKGYPGQSGN